VAINRSRSGDPPLRGAGFGAGRGLLRCCLGCRRGSLAHELRGALVRDPEGGADVSNRQSALSESTSDDARTFGGLSLQSFGIHSDGAHGREIITKARHARVDLHGVLALGGMTNALCEVDGFPCELLDLVEPARLGENSSA
jgi:hypothetical protein